VKFRQGSEKNQMTPPTQAEVTMGGTKVFTAEFDQEPAVDHCFITSLDKIIGPFTVLNPNPANQRGFADTHRFISTPGKRGIL
jgi:hypothetical protein